MIGWDGTTVASLICLHYLARKQAAATAAEIARSARLPATSARRALRSLQRRGLVTSKRRAGYVLTRAAGCISVLDGLGPRSSIGVTDYSSCPLRGSCPFAPVCESMNDAVRGALGGITFEDLRLEPAATPPCQSGLGGESFHHT